MAQRDHCLNQKSNGKPVMAVAFQLKLFVRAAQKRKYKTDEL
jgi:hypothetical protein